jgi:hypothetical protein
MKELYFKRKFFATLTSTFVISMIMASFTVWDEGSIGYGSNFILWTFIYIIFSGMIILIYGNLSSALIEFLLSKWKNESGVKIIIYIFLHIILGGFIGFLGLIEPYNFWGLALIGVLSATLFAISDVWYSNKIKRGEGAGKVPIVLFSIFLSISLVFAFFGKYINPLTKEEAIKYATFSPGNRFPKKEGKEIEKIGDFIITRETTVEKHKDNSYIITLNERWQGEKEQGSWFIKYKVNRQGASVIEEDEIGIPFSTSN